MEVDETSIIESVSQETSNQLRNVLFIGRILGVEDVVGVYWGFGRLSDDSRGGWPVIRRVPARRGFFRSRRELGTRVRMG